MRLLRSRLFAILIAALVLAGFGVSLFGSCDDEKQVVVAAAGSGGGEPAPSSSHSGDHTCACLCHQILVIEQLNAPAVAGAVSDAVLVFAELADIPPDAIPLGIDHPPQLA